VNVRPDVDFLGGTWLLLAVSLSLVCLSECEEPAASGRSWPQLAVRNVNEAGGFRVS
jgi:hypothetical protein